MKLIAIDPGCSGGIARMDEERITCGGMPQTEGDVLELLRHFSASGIRKCYLEEVGGFCGVGQPGSAMFKFGRGFGFLLGCLMALDYSVELVKPQRWQKSFSLGTIQQAGGKGDWKRKLKAEAQRRFPMCDVTLATADALLILEYGRRQEGVRFTETVNLV